MLYNLKSGSQLIGSLKPAETFLSERVINVWNYLPSDDRHCVF